MTARRKKTLRGGSAMIPLDQNELTLPGSWEEELQQYVTRDRAAATGVGGWPFLSTRGGVFSHGESVLGHELSVVVLGAIRENTYYAEGYDPDNPQPPSCFAVDLGGDEGSMAPPVELASRVSDACAACEMNAFGSSDTGRGKACKNTVRLAMLHFDPTRVGDLEKVDGAMLRIPPTSLGKFSGYAATVNDAMKRPFFTVVTKVEIEADPKVQFRVVLSPIGAVTQELYPTLRKRADEARGYLERLPDLATAGAARPQPRAGKQRRRKVTRTKKKVPEKKKTPRARRRVTAPIGGVTK
jgi:hypothetical protein